MTPSHKTGETGSRAHPMNPYRKGRAAAEEYTARRRAWLDTPREDRKEAPSEPENPYPKPAIGKAANAGWTHWRAGFRYVLDRDRAIWRTNGKGPQW